VTILAAEPQLLVTDVDAAAAWYRDRLGFAIAFVHGEPAFYAQVRRDAARLNLRHIDAMPESGERDLLAVTLIVDDLDTLFAAAAGADVHQPVATMDWGARLGILADPDGNLVALVAG
jgi:uncharacterized glyoxalase superfamily protein PhnB